METRIIYKTKSKVILKQKINEILSDYNMILQNNSFYFKNIYVYYDRKFLFNISFFGFSDILYFLSKNRITKKYENVYKMMKANKIEKFCLIYNQNIYNYSNPFLLKPLKFKSIKYATRTNCIESNDLIKKIEEKLKEIHNNLINELNERAIIKKYH
jgi:hypothetical protein